MTEPEVAGPDSAAGSAVAAPPGRTETADLVGRVGRSALWSAGATLLMRIANIAIMAVVARLLAPRDFGVFAVAVTVHAVVSSIGELGVSSCLMRGDLAADEIAPTIATISIGASVLLAAGMAGFAEPLSAALGSRDAAGPMRVMALAVLMVGVFAVPGAQLVRDFRQDRQFLATVIGFVPSNVLLVLMAATGQGAMAFAWSRVVGQLVTGTVIALSVSPRFRPGWSRRTVGHLLGFGLPLAGANLVNYTLLNADYALIGRLLGAVDLGVYMLAFNVSSWSSGLLGAMINGVAMPAFSRVKGDADLLRRALVGATRAVSLVAMPICGLTVGLNRPLIESLYGSRWREAAPVLAYLALYAAISIICLLFANFLVSLARTKILLLVQVVWLAALLPTMVAGVRLGGTVGGGVAHLVVVLVVVLPTYLVLLRRHGAVPARALGAAAAPAAAGSAVAAAAAYLSTLVVPGVVAQLLLGLLVGGLVYAFLVAPLVAEQVGPARQLAAPLGPLVRIGDRVMRPINPWYARALVRARPSPEAGDPVTGPPNGPGSAHEMHPRAAGVRVAPVVDPVAGGEG